MANPGLSDEAAREAVEAYRVNGDNASAAARALGLHRATYMNRLRKAAERGLLGTKPVLPGFVITGTSAQIGANGELEREWVRQSPEGEESQFTLPDGHSIKGVSALIGPDGNVKAQWVKTRAEHSVLDIVETIKSAFDGYTGMAELPPAPARTNDELLSVYVLTDVHHGLLAYGRETGEDYDISIGSARLRSCMSRLVSQSPESSEALILNLGDYFHSNDNTNATPASKHVLDIDTRFFKVVTTGIRLFMDCIDFALQKHDRVRVRCLPGNHDPESSLALTVALSAFYHNNPRVIVEESPSEFFFHLFGNTLIGACHGHRMKPDRMAMSMAMMRPDDWGASKFRWFLFGHIHHESVKEIGNVRCESFQTIAGKDAYSVSHGYQSGQSLSSVTLHREHGEISRQKVNVI